MSGICGIAFNDKDYPLDLTQLWPMLLALDVSGQGQGFTVNLGSVGMGARSSQSRLAGVAELTLHGRPFALAFHGNLHNLKELYPIEAQDSNLFMGLLRLYLKEGITFLQRLRGEFALALWDGRSEA